MALLVDRLLAWRQEGAVEGTTRPPEHYHSPNHDPGRGTWPPASSDDDNDGNSSDNEQTRIVTGNAGYGSDEETFAAGAAGDGRTSRNSDALEDTTSRTRITDPALSSARTQQQAPTNGASSTNESTPNGAEATPEEENGEEGRGGNNNSGLSAVQASSRERDDILPRYSDAPFLLFELESQRDNLRRRNITCTLGFSFFLLRLWVEALTEGNVGLLLLALLGTSWMVRWVETQREADNEIASAIHDYNQRANGDNTGTESGGPLSASAMAQASAIESGDLRVVAWQAQLALAILESQREIMELGDAVGSHPSLQEAEGLDEEARSRWSTYTHHCGHNDQNAVATATARSTGEGHPRGKKRFGLILGKHSGYGSVSSLDSGGDVDLEAGGQQQPFAENLPAIPSSSSSSPPHHPSGGRRDSSSLELQKGDGDTNGEHHLKDAACSICLCEYEEGETLSKLPCGHIYHDNCITAWVERHVRCPLCNFDLRQEHQSELEARISDIV